MMRGREWQVGRKGGREGSEGIVTEYNIEEEKKSVMLHEF